MSEVRRGQSPHSPEVAHCGSFQPHKVWDEQLELSSRAATPLLLAEEVSPMVWTIYYPQTLCLHT